MGLVSLFNSAVSGPPAELPHCATELEIINTATPACDLFIPDEVALCSYLKSHGVIRESLDRTPGRTLRGVINQLPTAQCPFVAPSYRDTIFVSPRPDRIHA